MGLYDFTVLTHDQREQPLNEYAGSAVLIANTASECGLTPQYAGLQELHQRFADRGLKVLAFPCNQFGHQEPGEDAAIQDFCRTNYGVSFPVFAKIDVNGETAHPLYHYLTGLADPGPIQWNFTKFLFDRSGHLVGRYEPAVDPAALSGDIERALA